MAKNSKPFTEAWLIEKGYSKSTDGSFIPKSTPKVTIEKVIEKELVVKERVNNSPDFEIKVPVTEWFIKNYSVPSKKNSRQNFVKNGKQISIPSKNHSDYVKMTAMQYSVFGKEFRNTVKFYELKYPLKIELTFVRSTKHRFDYCNAAQTVEDLIVKNNWIEDDSADHLIPIFIPYEFNKEVPGVKIKLIVK